MSLSIKFTKGTVIVLVISLLLSVACFVAGGVILADENSHRGSYGDSYGGSSSGSSEVTIYNTNSTQYLSSYSGRTIDLIFSPNSTGTYKIYTKNLDVEYFENEYGSSVSYSSVYNDWSSSYDSCYEVDLYSSYSYTITVYVRSNAAVYVEFY